MSSMAEYAIENGFDPFLAPGHIPWEDTPAGRNRLYDQEDKPIPYRDTKKHPSEFDNFKDAMTYCRNNAPATLKLSNGKYIVSKN
ncbi:TPA: hypothetical protein ACGFD3_003523 [Acinetobacter baumannii]|uniref:hypothetical protein n=1 Tax=Acinetobacter calcoaceticus/baumannii complex TaxID=909768 RepID=UPI001901F857|nr:hypothetical protein [Acinetobacter baumannii]MBJ9701954.1 hypothetical protein [Acinetobacter baumannii]MCD0193234.1 hypothetical protein [Acinetobacter baumannii]MCF1257148.1 hypothetical protein [Acinetobacter baumannii]MCZ6922853.1 hypothetical protein [Acinetobacter baumannii]MDN8255250.1 hypothetical protein [Acinetobacter baumannii]